MLRQFLTMTDRPSNLFCQGFVQPRLRFRRACEGFRPRGPARRCTLETKVRDLYEHTIFRHETAMVGDQGDDLDALDRV